MTDASTGHTGSNDPTQDATVPDEALGDLAGAGEPSPAPINSQITDSVTQ